MPYCCSLFLRRAILSFTLINYTFAMLVSTNVSFSGYEKWNPVGSARDDLYCPTHCLDDKYPEECCSCNAKACWEIDQAACGVVVGQLYIEYTDIFGSAVLVADSKKNATIYELIHLNGKLQRLPDNICDWKDTLFTVDLRNNRIANISEIRCLIYLDKLQMDNNRITQIPNDTFSEMEQLRVLTLSQNLIEKLDPNTIKVKNGNIFNTDLSFNDIEVIDITNIARPGPFCNLSYEGCSLREQTNTNGFKLSEGVTYGPGDTHLESTDIGTFLNFTAFGIEDYYDVPKYFLGSFHMDESSVNCDCGLFPLVDGLGGGIGDFWPEIDQELGFICSSPEHMIGVNLTSIIKSENYDILTCPLTERCPSVMGFYCECIDYPSLGRVIVNCSGRGLKTLPHDLPVGLWKNDQIELLVDNNHITIFESRNYLDRLISINLEHNLISEVSEDVGHNAAFAEVQIQNQILKNLPRSFQLLDPNKLHFGPNPINCDCNNLWIGDWIRANKADGRLKCLVNDIIYGVEEITSNVLVCNEEDDKLVYIVGSVSLLVLVIILSVAYLLYYYRYEIYLLKRKLFRKVNECSLEGYDVFISFYDDNEAAFNWINHELLPALERNGYSVYIPWFNAQYGEQREEALLNTISISRNYVVFLCEEYLQEEKTISEFDTIWKNFKREDTKNIIVINFAPLFLDQIVDRRLKAFVRIADDLDFSVTENKLFERLKKRLGVPKSVPAREPLDEDQLNKSNETPANQIEDNANKEDSNKKKKWFERLSVRKPVCDCDCKYRRCYLHAEKTKPFSLDSQNLKQRIGTRTNESAGVHDNHTLIQHGPSEPVAGIHLTLEDLD